MLNKVHILNSPEERKRYGHLSVTGLVLEAILSADDNFYDWLFPSGALPPILDTTRFGRVYKLKLLKSKVHASKRPKRRDFAF